MKQSAFIVILFVIALAASIGIYEFILGDPANFKDAARHVPINYLGTAYVGGVLVSLLICLSIMVIAIAIERFLTLRKAAGKQLFQNSSKK